MGRLRRAVLQPKRQPATDYPWIGEALHALAQFGRIVAPGVETCRGRNRPAQRFPPALPSLRTRARSGMGASPGQPGSPASGSSAPVEAIPEWG